MNEESIKAYNIVDLVSYQEGAVVSRTLIDKKNGTVTLFAFDSGEGLSEHTAPFDALVFLIEGEGEVRISDKKVQLREGEMVVLPANQPHSLNAINRFKMLLTMIKS